MPRRLIAENQPIAAHRADRPIEEELNQGSAARRDAAAFEDRNPAGHVGSTEMNMHRHPVAQRRLFSGQRANARIDAPHRRSEEHTSELQSLMRISYAVFCLKKKKNQSRKHTCI